MTGRDDHDSTGVTGQRGRGGRLLGGLQALVHQFIDERLDKLFKELDEQLFDIADKAHSQREQTHFFDAMRSLRQHRGELGAGMLAAVEDVFGQLGGGAVSRGKPTPEDNDDLSLQLVDNEVLEEMITLDTMVSRVIERAYPEMDWLASRLSFVAGHTLSEHANPFVPEFLCENFARQVARLKLDFEPRLVILRIFDAVMFKDWPDLVRRGNTQLREGDVLADLEKRRPPIKKTDPATVRSAEAEPANPGPESRAPSGTGEVREAPVSPPGDSGPGRPRSGPGNGPSSPAGEFGGERLQDREHRYGDVLADLHRLAREDVRREQQAPAFYLGADELAGLIASWRQGKAHDDLLATLAGQGLERAVAEILAANDQGLESLTEIDQSVLRLLDKTFSRLGHSGKLAAEASQVLLRLELPAAWLALKDPLFLERQNHPGRRLINELCRVSSTLGGDDLTVNDPMRRKIDEIIQRLDAFDMTIRELTGLLTDFIDFVEKDKRNINLREERVLQEEDAQAKLADAHGQVLRVLSDRLVGRRWPGFLVTFCEKAWCRVLFLACVRHGQQSAEWRQALALLDRLLVLASARRAVDASEQADILGGVGEALLHIGYDPGDSSRYLEQISGFFAALSAGQVETGQEPLAALAVELPGARPEPDLVPEDLDPETLAYVDALKRGAWVEFRDAGKAVRCKLAGIVKASSKLVFTNRKGAKVAEESRHRMAIKMQEGKVIVLDNSHLFDQAYDQVIHEVQAELRTQTIRV